MLRFTTKLSIVLMGSVLIYCSSGQNSMISVSMVVSWNRIWGAVSRTSGMRRIVQRTEVRSPYSISIISRLVRIVSCCLCVVLLTVWLCSCMVVVSMVDVAKTVIYRLRARNITGWNLLQCTTRLKLRVKNLQI